MTRLPSDSSFEPARCAFTSRRLRRGSIQSLGIKMKARVGIALVCAALTSRVGVSAIEDHIYYSVVPGRYAVIGQYPDGGRTYSGRAKVAYKNGRLELTKQINGEEIAAVGSIERAASGDAEVIRFRWPGYESTCLVRGDLDNYSRLTCYWYANGAAHKQPGLEAYFPIEAWPDRTANAKQTAAGDSRNART